MELLITQGIQCPTTFNVMSNICYIFEDSQNSLIIRLWCCVMRCTTTVGCAIIVIP